MKLRSRSKSARKTHGRTPRISSAPGGKAAQHNPLVLQAECTQSHAEELKGELCALLEHKETVTLDAGAVERVDTAALQLLAAFVRDRHLAGRAVEWCAASSALVSAVQLLGMDAMLSLNEAHP